MKIEIGKKYLMNPPIEKKGAINKGAETTIVKKADTIMKQNIETLFPHHANGMGWYATSEGQWGREDWFTEVR